MSTTTTPEPSPSAAGTLQSLSVTPIETAPSTMVKEGPAFARVLFIIGLFLLVLGIVVVAVTRIVGPRAIPEGWGFILGAVGLIMMLYHSAVDGELEFRRIYGGAALFLLVLAVVVSLLPGPWSGTGTKTVGYYMLPWGAAAALLSLLFSMTFLRHETEDLYRNLGEKALLTVGTLLTVGSATAGAFNPGFLAGPGIVLALLGVGFLCAFFSKVETSDGVGYTVAFTLGVFGAITLVYAVARAIVPTVLYDGPSVLRRTDQSLDNWKALGRGLVILAFLAIAALGALGRFPIWLRASLGAVGIAGAGVFVAACFGSYVSVQPRPYLVPGGVSLMAMGLLYLGVSLGVCSDNQFVTLTRRELSAYFLSPIGIMVLVGMALAQWLSYAVFVGQLLDGRTHEEPIVERYGTQILNVFVFAVQIPIITMRLLAEEKRTGSLEVLLTAPVNEAVVVGSKFLGALMFFMICWLPMGLYLIALRMEAGQPFDYRPILGFYVCLAAQGAMFVSMGLFFSSLTKNQIVAAVLTFVVLESLLFFAILRFNPTVLPLPDVILAVAGRLSFYHIWLATLSGQLPVRDVLLALSLSVFGLFLTVKVLEIRKWS